MNSACRNYDQNSTYFVFNGREFCRCFLFGFDESMFSVLQLCLLCIQLILVLRHCRFVLTETSLNKQTTCHYHTMFHKTCQFIVNYNSHRAKNDLTGSGRQRDIVKKDAREHIGPQNIETNLQQRRLQWLGHIHRMDNDIPVFDTMVIKELQQKTRKSQYRI